MAAQSPRPYILDLANEPEESLRFYCVVSLRLSCPFSSGAKLEIFEKEWDTHSSRDGGALTIMKMKSKSKEKNIKLQHLKVRPGLEMGGVAPNPRCLHLVIVEQSRLRQFRIVAQLSSQSFWR